MEADSIQEALKVLHEHGYSNRALGRLCPVSRDTLDKIVRGHVVTKKRRDVFRDLMKVLCQVYDQKFRSGDFDECAKLKNTMFELFKLDYGI